MQNPIIFITTIIAFLGTIFFVFRKVENYFSLRVKRKELIHKVSRDILCSTMEAKLLYFIATAPKGKPYTISQIVSVSRGGTPLEFDPLFQHFIEERLQPLIDAKLIRSETWFEEVTNYPNQVFLLGSMAPKLFRNAAAHFQAGVEPPKGGAIILDFPKPK
jgi:hypothetical protein